MQSHQDNYSENLRIRLENDPKLNGLDAFRKHMEKDFFSEVTIRNCSRGGDQGNLVIELDCALNLKEILFHLKKGIWGNLDIEKKDVSVSSFSKALRQLKQLNQTKIDIEEFSVFLKDTAVIIKKIYDQSIPDQLESIFCALLKHQKHYTLGHTVVPYEIYIPVFEENLLENNTTLLNIKSGNNSCKDYFGFWGLYFDSEEDAVIYDLADKSIISGDLYMLNH